MEFVKYSRQEEDKSMSKPLLEIKDLCVWFKVFGGILKVLNKMNIIVWPGERVGLVGEMGCGKTTTMKAIMRILPIPPAIIPSGEILFKGKDILKMSYAELQQIRKKSISMIFEDPTASLNPVFTVGIQLQDIAKQTTKIGKGKTKKDIKQDVIQALKEVALPDPERIFRNYPIQLSGGMRQRICIATTLISDNELMICDEPGTSLDVTIKDQIYRLLKKLVEERSKSIILITHGLGEIKNLTDRVYVMYAGSIVEVAKTRELFVHPVHPYSQGLFIATPKLSGGIGEGIPGHIPDYMNPPIGCRFHPRCKYVMQICREKKPPIYKVSEDHEVACFLFQNRR